jgi:hypothetical protein
MPFADLKDRTQRSRCFQNVGTELSLCELFGIEFCALFGITRPAKFERTARVARAIGVVAVGAGLFLIARAAELG